MTIIKNSFNNKNTPDRDSVLEDFMTAASDAVAKTLYFEKLQANMKLTVILKTIH